jgi:hypothetical protein
MNELTLMQSFRAERDAEPAEAREAIWRALEARIEAATEESLAFGEAVARTAPRPATVRRRRGLPAVRGRRVLIFAAAALLAAIATSVLVLRSGPTAQPASAAEILHEAASAAAAADAPTTLVPGPGKYLYRDEQRLGVEGWVSPVPHPDEAIPTASMGAPMKGPHAYNGLLATRSQTWLGDEGQGRRRDVLAGLDFWSKTEEGRWHAAGSPLPPPWNPEYRQIYKSAYEGATEQNTHVIDELMKGYGDTRRPFHFPDTSMLPTEAPALRQEAEANELDYTGFNHVGGKEPKQLDAKETKEELLNVLQEGFPSPPLQAAIFNALAELPGIKVIRDTTDGTGRHGAGIVARVEDGVESQTIFDPDTGELLGTRAILVDPGTRGLEGIPAGTIIDERDFLAVGVVDSTDEVPEGAEAPAN